MTDSRKGGLGRGLAALIPTGPSAGAGTAAERVARLRRPAPIGPPVDLSTAALAVSRETTTIDVSIGAIYREVPIEAVRPNARQPRQVFDEQAMSELAHSIREFGLLQPIVVRETGFGSYELVMGERRWRAAQEAGQDRIPAIVRQTADNAMLRDALLENIHRVQLNPLEEAAAYQQLLDEFEVTHEELADRLGRSRPAITNTIRLLKLPVAVQRRVAAGVLSAGHARALLALEDAGAQEDLAARIVAEGMSVRATEEAVLLARGAAPIRPRPPRRKPLQAPGLQDLAERLSNTFDTRVKVELGRRKGRIVVEFGSVDDLERIVALMHRDQPVAPARPFGDDVTFTQ
ncbi:MAG TPA: ParB/RepB/Spo0J family partition protein [Pseudonocardiaceae bacterium]|jgi:ParB family chromosome partitioning protein